MIGEKERRGLNISGRSPFGDPGAEGCEQAPGAASRGSLRLRAGEAQRGSQTPSSGALSLRLVDRIGEEAPGSILVALVKQDLA